MEDMVPTYGPGLLVQIGLVAVVGPRGPEARVAKSNPGPNDPGVCNQCNCATQKRRWVMHQMHPSLFHGARLSGP